MSNQEHEKSSVYTPPTGARKQLSIVHRDGQLNYTAQADWLVLRKREKPKAEIFYVAYIAEREVDAGARPITFVFNGGPGASSVYLHLGTVGPRRAQFTEHGGAPPPPFTLVDNRESWLAFTDLVFVDPVGTGFSRMIEEGDDKPSKGESDGRSSKDDGEEERSEYWQVKRDLESLCEFMRTFLSTHHRWESPIYVAGESYGGFRTAKLTRMAQQEYGVGLAGAVIISPALEFTLLNGSDYDTLMWLDAFPTMAAAAFHHGKARRVQPGEDLRDYMERAAAFGVRELLPILATGDLYGEEAKARVLRRAADFIGLSRDVVVAKNGKVDILYFVKNLRRSERIHLGLYDASRTVTDPYPDRDEYNGPDPTLHQVDRVFASGINTQLRTAIGLETDRDYNLLSHTVNRSWKVDTRTHALETHVGATDDLRYGMSLNSDMKVWLCHGIFDLVTPYFATDRIANLMKLTSAQKGKLTVKHYGGGHMFYTWDASRIAFFEDMRTFYAS